MSHGFALITGGTTGIGAAFAKLLPESTSLLLVARNEEKLAERRAELERPGRTVETVAADLSTREGRDKVLDKAAECEIDLLINNAGAGRFARVLDNAPDDELATVELNVVAPTVLTRALLPGMIERARRDRRRCGLILVSSTTAFQPIPLLTTYSATKSFVLAYGEGLREETRRDPLDLLVLCPGATRTEFSERSGFDLGSIPGADDPMKVAREGLENLGHCTVHVVGMGTRAALTPFLIPRRIATTGAGAIMSILGKVNRLKPRQM
ncbi:SDR family NAD(P)-dependent oxidoreductase [Skermanella pratensis]|uniref:SDR family NAD(P)-dependent oxidoreductase n=1 Tax=Skermanella pratensis TaxID=2233999 RepID=UPI0013016443|nr:SDR family NAD(P)-dependent oxidoreductase [Skermanella pratensis]